MATLGMQMLASALCLLGWVGVIASCVMPMWRVTAFVGSTIVTSQTIWEGIWMSCVAQATGQISCKPYESLLALSPDLQAARALTVLAIATGAGGLLLAFVGGKCTRFLDEAGKGEAAKGRVAVAAGAVLIATGVLCLIPTSWAASAVVRKFYSSSIDAQKREIGACLYIGWGASILLILGGGLFINSSCPLKAHEDDKSPSVRYLVVRSSNAGGGSSQGASQRSRGPSQPGGPASARSISKDRASLNSQPRGLVRTRPPWEEEVSVVEQENRPGSGASKTPSTKSQLKRLETGSTKSEQSDGASTTKSQLKRAGSEESLAESAKSEAMSSNAAKTYI